jgi:hypothetical protein
MTEPRSRAAGVCLRLSGGGAGRFVGTLEAEARVFTGSGLSIHGVPPGTIYALKVLASILGKTRRPCGMYQHGTPPAVSLAVPLWKRDHFDGARGLHRRPQPAGHPLENAAPSAGSPRCSRRHLALRGYLCLGSSETAEPIPDRFLPARRPCATAGTLGDRSLWEEVATTNRIITSTVDAMWNSTMG